MPWKPASALLDRVVADLELGRDRDRGERVAHVVQAGQVQLDGERRRVPAAGPWNRVVPPSRSSAAARMSASSPRP